MTDKKTLREKYKKFDKSVCSECVTAKLVQTKEYKEAKNIMIFYPLDNEVNLLMLMEDKTKNFFLPKIEGDELLCCPYCSADKLCLSRFRTQEPLTKPCDKSKIDLVVVPALLCDLNNYRLGYGGGYYDRFLKDYEGKTICCIPKELVVETVYPEEYDIKVDRVVTD